MKPYTFKLMPHWDIHKIFVATESEDWSALISTSQLPFDFSFIDYAVWYRNPLYKLNIDRLRLFR